MELKHIAYLAAHSSMLQDKYLHSERESFHQSYVPPRNICNLCDIVLSPCFLKLNVFFFSRVFLHLLSLSFGLRKLGCYLWHSDARHNWQTVTAIQSNTHNV